MASDDPYLYPGSQVLRNKPGFRDAEELRGFEYAETYQQSLSAPAFPLTAAGYKELHRHLFGNVFEWAGELRTIDFTKGGSAFASAHYLDHNLDKLFADLAARNGLRGLAGERFAEGAAHHVSELNVIHPFRVMLNCKR